MVLLFQLYIIKKVVEIFSVSFNFISFHAAPALSKEAIAEMSPSAAAASALMKKGMSLTQVVKYDFEFGFLWPILETGSQILSFY